jgi:hypothetical protein
MIICSSNNIDYIQGVVAYGNEPLITDWRIENSNGVLNILNSKSNNANLAVLESGNINIGTTNQSGSLSIYGNVNITGNYNKNNRDVINDTSNYVLSSSNILVNRIVTEVNYTSNYVSRLSFGSSGESSQWITSNANIYYNTSNVGIGTFNPLNKLHIYNNTIQTTALTIQNAFGSSASISSFPQAPIIGYDGNYTYMMFTYTTETAGAGSGQTQYTLTSPTGGVVCDVLIVGGGGAGNMVIGGGGGGGAVLYATGITIPAGSYTIKVGKGGTRNVNGSQSEAFGATCLGGGSQPNATWPTPINGRAGGSGSGGSSGDSGSTSSGGGVGASTKGTILSSGTLYNGSSGGSGIRLLGSGARAGGGGGGGGAGTAGRNAVQVDYSTRQAWINAGKPSSGGDGVLINITGTGYYWGAGGGGGIHVGQGGADGGLGGGGGGGTQGTAGGLGGTGGISAGGNGGTSSTQDGGNGGAHTGSGGGGSTFTGSVGSSGGSGVIIVRYQGVPTSSSIELIRGSSGDSNIDYKIGNYNGEFKIISSILTDTDYIRITAAGAIYNPTGSSVWSTTSDRRIKENIEKASYDKCYENINKLDLYRFNYINGFNNINKDLRQLGYIAQEVNEIFPKAVTSQSFNNNEIDIPDLLTIDISQINYSLYGAVKKLMEMNYDKDRRIKRLETLLNIEDVSTTSNISLDTSNISIDTSNISIDTSNISIDTSNIAIDASNLPIDTSNLSIDTSNLSIDTSNLSIDTSNISIDTSNLSIDTSNLPIDTSNLSIDTSNLTIDTSNLSIDTSNLNSNTSNLNSNTSNIEME